jgi:hypothetical protein
VARRCVDIRDHRHLGLAWIASDSLMTDRKKPGVAFWVIVALVAVVLYPLSMGPAFWAWQDVFGRSETCWMILSIIYAPIGAACENVSVNAAVSWWVSRWTEG